MAGPMTPEDLAIEDRSDQRDPDDMIRYRMVTLERKLEDEYGGRRLKRQLAESAAQVDTPA